MQKVLKRTVLAERQAARRLARRKDKNLRDWRKSNREQVNYVRRDEIGQLKQARLNRREDYELGPLAPRRDVGNWSETYGTINSQRARGQDLPKEKLEEKLKFWGGKKFLNLRQGDRVVLLEGRDKGKIGTVKDVNTRSAEVAVEGLNMVRSPPESLLQATYLYTSFRLMSTSPNG
jgi:large subunit ribosomal protein L24